jgi:glycosyltransferase involved in cell wall biosynthesis
MAAKIPMRICVVEPRSSGGMIHYAYQLCNALSDYVTEVTLITAQHYELNDYPHKFKVNKLLKLWKRNDATKVEHPRSNFEKIWETIFWNVRRVGRGIRWYFEWLKLAAYLLKTKPDIVQFGEIEFAPESFLLHFLRSRGLILAEICHEFEPRETKKGLLWTFGSRLLRDAFRAFSILFFHSKSNQDRFEQLFPDIPTNRFHLIPMGNGLIFPQQGNDHSIRNTLQSRYGIKSDDLVILFFGNITPSKGVPDLLNAFSIVHKQNNRARLVIAGMPLKYIDMSSLEDQAAALGIKPATYFDTRYLPMEEVGPLMDLATVVVYPYISSTQSASIQAAYACGKPVIATRVGGLPDVVKEGESGLLVEPNCPEELSEAIIKIIHNPELAKQMGRCALEISETNFAWNPIAENIVGVYRELLVKKQKIS